jgi:hypothetical protein
MGVFKKNLLREDLNFQRVKTSFIEPLKKRTFFEIVREFIQCLNIYLAFLPIERWIQTETIGNGSEDQNRWIFGMVQSDR